MEAEKLIEVITKLKSDNEQMKRMIEHLTTCLSIFEEEYKAVTPIINHAKKLLTEIENDDK
jgi:hypothetical protein